MENVLVLRTVGHGSEELKDKLERTKPWEKGEGVMMSNPDPSVFIEFPKDEVGDPECLLLLSITRSWTSGNYHDSVVIERAPKDLPIAGSLCKEADITEDLSVALRDFGLWAWFE